ncbi:hypothetical protein OG292_29540 [Streptomyces sp. NBC_01511]|uniref:hypothetical protein n=1 Tax=Streptomyces sp. NBC_01511 TaxID=2903889 RepID=UPI003866644D
MTLKVLCDTPHLSMYNSVLVPAWQGLTGGTLLASAVDQLASAIEGKRSAATAPRNARAAWKS